MYQADVLIAGAGPAGVAAALVLARAGLAVTMVDKAKFPRDKLCAGLLTWKTMRSLARLTGESPETLMASGIINHRTRQYRIRHREFCLSQGQLVYPFHFVDRRIFDDWLLDRAKQAGVLVIEGLRVLGAEPEQARLLCAQGQTCQGQWLIGADGANSQIRKSFDLDGASWRREKGLGLEVYVTRQELSGLKSPHEDLLADFPTVYSGFVKAGYGWVFPHQDKIIVGLGGLYRANRLSEFKTAMGQFLNFLGLNPGHQVRAHPLPYGNWLDRPWQGRTLLAGDAAGLVEPLFGEGIHYALRSGELAGEACLAAIKQGQAPGPVYQRALEAEIFPELRYSRYLRRALYFFVRLGLTRPVKLFLRGGGVKLQEMVHGLRSFRWLKRKQEPHSN